MTQVPSPGMNRRTFLHTLCVNVLGLILNALGAGLLVFFTPPSLEVTATGENLVSWANSPAPEQRAANLSKYRRHWTAFKAGMILLCTGFILQLWGICRSKGPSNISH